MTKQYDAGDIVWQERIEIKADQVWGAVEIGLTPLIARAVSFVISNPEAEGQPHTPIIDPPYHGYTLADGDTLTESETRHLCRATLPKFCGISRCKYFRRCRL
jgi:hypothetical protein